MAAAEDFTELPEDFNGRVRLFPLPNAVLLPYGTLPLRIFEPRYREMLADALADDRLIAMATFSPGWEQDYEGRPPLAPMVCLGRVVADSKLPTGESNILLSGVQRARIERELPPQRSYREAVVEVLYDQYSADATPQRPHLRRQLLNCFRRFLQQTTLAQQQIDEMLSADISLGMLTDIVAFTLDLPGKLKQEMLAEVNVDGRAETLLQHLNDRPSLPAEADAVRPVFPPKFSNN